MLLLALDTSLFLKTPARGVFTFGEGSSIIDILRVSYNGYYVSFPRMRREFDSLHPHQIDKFGKV